MTIKGIKKDNLYLTFFSPSSASGSQCAPVVYGEEVVLTADIRQFSEVCHVIISSVLVNNAVGRDTVSEFLFRNKSLNRLGSLSAENNIFIFKISLQQTIMHLLLSSGMNTYSSAKRGSFNPAAKLIPLARTARTCVLGSSFVMCAITCIISAVGKAMKMFRAASTLTS